MTQVNYEPTRKETPIWKRFQVLVNRAIESENLMVVLTLAEAKELMALQEEVLHNLEVVKFYVSPASDRLRIPYDTRRIEYAAANKVVEQARNGLKPKGKVTWT